MTLTRSSDCTIPGEVSAIALLANSALPSPVIAIATWTNEILLYTLEHLSQGLETVTSLKEGYFAQSLSLQVSTASTSPTSGVQLMAGLSDGSLVIFELEQGETGGGLVVKNRKISSLGTRPLQLCPITVGGKQDETIIAVGLTERMSVIFEARDRVDFSSVSLKVGSVHYLKYVLTKIPRMSKQQQRS